MSAYTPEQIEAAGDDLVMLVASRVALWALTLPLSPAGISLTVEWVEKPEHTGKIRSMVEDAVKRKGGNAPTGVVMRCAARMVGDSQRVALTVGIVDGGA